MKKVVLVFVLGIFYISLLAQNPDSSYVGADTTLAGYKIGHQIGSWMPVVMILTIMILYIRHAYRHGKLKKGKMEEFD